MFDSLTVIRNMRRRRFSILPIYFTQASAKYLPGGGACPNCMRAVIRFEVSYANFILEIILVFENVAVSFNLGHAYNWTHWILQVPHLVILYENNVWGLMYLVGRHNPWLLMIFLSVERYIFWKVLIYLKLNFHARKIILFWVHYVLIV